MIEGPFGIACSLPNRGNHFLVPPTSHLGMRFSPGHAAADSVSSSICHLPFLIGASLSESLPLWLSDEQYDGIRGDTCANKGYIC